MAESHFKYHLDNSKNNNSIVKTDRKHRIAGWAFDESDDDVARSVSVYLNGEDSCEDYQKERD